LLVAAGVLMISHRLQDLAGRWLSAARICGRAALGSRGSANRRAVFCRGSAGWSLEPLRRPDTRCSAGPGHTERHGCTRGNDYVRVRARVIDIAADCRVRVARS
jgi:hypothetical protein